MLVTPVQPEVGAGATPERFGELFEDHATAVYNYCFRRLADWALAEDMTSAVFLEAWRRRNQVDLLGAPALPWLLGVATNLLRNHRRSYGVRALRSPASTKAQAPPTSGTSSLTDSTPSAE